MQDLPAQKKDSRQLHKTRTVHHMDTFVAHQFFSTNYKTVYSNIHMTRIPYQRPEKQNASDRLHVNLLI